MTYVKTALFGGYVWGMYEVCMTYVKMALFGGYVWGMYVVMLSCGLGIFFAFFLGFWEPVQKGGDVDERDLGGDNNFFFVSFLFLCVFSAFFVGHRRRKFHAVKHSVKNRCWVSDSLVRNFWRGFCRAIVMK
jgi:hypothetical protein